MDDTPQPAILGQGIPVLQGLLTAVKAMASFDAFSKKKSGEVRALIEELKENSRLCFRVVEDQVPHQNVIPRFSTRMFDQLNQEGFDFNALKRQKISPFPGIEKSDLASWPGKSRWRRHRQRNRE